MGAPANAPPSRAGSLPLVGGVLALDFCNTASDREGDGTVEHLTTPMNLLDWVDHAGFLDETAQARLRTQCADEIFGQVLLRRAVALRDATYVLGAALAAHRSPDQAAVDAVAAEHAACLALGQLMARDGTFSWTWRSENVPEAALLGPIAGSALTVLTQVDRARLKQCQGHRCGWLFLDTTKSNNRRWCEMEVCGNRAKQKRRRVAALNP